MEKIKILVVFGTRPEAIKLSPLIHKLKHHPFFETRVCATAQHREMLDQVLSFFSIIPDYDLNMMKKNQSLTETTASILLKLNPVLKDFPPDMVLVQGDTTTTFAAGLAAFYERIPVAHVEAGLRTHDPSNPWPEETNRKLTTHLSKYHFVPTLSAYENLIKENIPPNRIHITGNTGIDALLETLKILKQSPGLQSLMHEYFSYLSPHKHLILVTGHRRESFGKGLETLCASLIEIVKQNNDAEIVFPAHPNPTVQETTFRTLQAFASGNDRRIHLISPLPYPYFVYLMHRSKLIITDSGGIQEEAPSLGKPVLVTRQTTERCEALNKHAVFLVGYDESKIAKKTAEILSEQTFSDPLDAHPNPYGDGQAAQRIVEILSTHMRDITAASDFYYNSTKGFSV